MTCLMRNLILYGQKMGSMDHHCSFWIHLSCAEVVILDWIFLLGCCEWRLKYSVGKQNSLHF
ncbi:hypothetical protein P5673_005354 [Acropora cervicornis]|uniref:Uncharacterized protein n=1 Tax=Acropora cervicornis TaxID=6130 RepID=A0AAD9QXW8_ACRCE|nr:hypothetical protein P5673_005354 [Acropora cervicornis]